MKLIALTELPNRVKAGEPFEVSDFQAGILIRLGVAQEDTTADDAPKTKRTYRRRDLTAEN